MKQINLKYLILMLSAIAGFGMSAACSFGANENPAGAKNSGATTAQSASANDKSGAANKSAENKIAGNVNSGAAQNDLVEIYDGRKSITEAGSSEATAAQKDLVTKEFKAKESIIKQKMGDAFSCEDSDVNDIGITGVAKGSFTKPNSSQEAFLYEVCDTGSSHFGVGGIMIFEDGKIVSHYVYGENGLMTGGMFTLPDINKNGVSELVLTDGQTHQGYGTESLEIVEFKDGNLNDIGGTTVSKDNSGAVEADSKVEAEAFKISVQPSANPTFFRETYTQKGNSKNYSLSKKSEKFSLDKGNFGKNYKVN